MAAIVSRLTARAKRSARRCIESAAAPATAVILKLLRMIDPDRGRAIGAAVMRSLGPWLPEHRVGRANLAAAFPDKSAGEIETILRGVWDNLGRVGVEVINLDRIGLTRREHESAIDFPPEEQQRLTEIARDGKATLFFASHLANWETSAVAAANRFPDTVVLYRRPNIDAVADALIAIRAGVMGPMIPQGLDAPVRLARALQEGHHVGMLIDQHFSRGVAVTFFGRTCLANPLIAKLARQLECPIRGLRAVRLPGDRFRGHITDEIAPARDAEGRIDVQGTMQILTTVIEGWVREHPEQWLWLHRRWR